MSSPIESAQALQFYVTTTYNCSYIPKNLAQSLIATPENLINSAIYSNLIEQGFRRSGKFVYRPHCQQCSACVPVRLISAAFKANRSQKRCFKQHNNLIAKILPLQFNEAHLSLYDTYQNTRHKDDNSTSSFDSSVKISAEKERQYRDFLIESNVETLLIEFKLNGILKIVSVVDVVLDGVSAVYTFYDTQDKQASYGTYSIMWLNEWVLNLNLPYLYLGYWVNESPKMAYKQKYQPQEALIHGKWQLNT